MKHLLLIIFLLSPFLGATQSTQKIDSLKKVLAKLPAEGKSFSGDTLRVRVLCALGGTIGHVYFGDSSLVFLKKALEISEKQNWEEGVAISHFHLGEFYNIKNEFMKAIDFFYKCLAISIEQENEILTANTYKSLGDCYSSLGNYEKALLFNLKSNNIFKNKKDQNAYIKGLNNLGLVYYEMQSYDKAIAIFKRGIILNKRYHYPKLDTYFKINMGMSLVKKGSYAEALNNFQEVLKEKNRNPYNDIYIYISIADIHEKKREFEMALKFYDKAKKLISKSKGNDSVQMYLEEVGYKIFKNTNQYKKAFESYQIYNEVTQRNTKQDKERRIKNLQLEFDNQNQEKEIESWKRNVMFAVIGISVLLVLGLLLFKTNNKLTSQNKTIEIQKIEIEKANEQLAEFNVVLEERIALRTQELSEANQKLIRKNQEISEALFKGQSIERTRVASALHDNIGGTMTAMKWMLESIDTANLSEDDQQIYRNILNIATETYSDVRFMSHNFIPKVLAELGLQDALKKLCQEISETKRLQLHFENHTFSEFSHQIELEIYSICLELITNILKHSKATEASIVMSESQTNLTIEVTDNGKGINQENIKGKGLKSIHQRLESIRGTFEIKNNPQTATCFLMIVPLVMTEEYMTLLNEK